MILKYEHLLLNLLCIVISVKCLARNLPYVKTPLGGIRGSYKQSAEGRQYAAYESIRYAEPPIGELRFEPPKPVRPWSEDIEALSSPPACLQYDTTSKVTTGIEDCLFLNIYVPRKSKVDSMPVIFWIHGGGFQTGTSSDSGPKFLMDRDVILVTVNYRVGPFGFLTTGDQVVPGNTGLKDQSLALKWISENIEYFGGDPQRISLLGESTGAASVHYHYLSPMSRGLFQNGISFSASALGHSTFSPDATQNTKDFAKLLKCPTDNSLRMVQCLKSLPSSNITAAIQDLVVSFGLDKEIMEYIDKNWEFIGPYMLTIKNSIPSHKHSRIVMKSREHYFGNESITTDMGSIKKLTHLIGDQLITIGVIRAIRLHARYNKSPARFYYYTYRAAQSISDSMSNTTIDFGVCHGDDVCVVLDNDSIDATKTANDRAMQQDLINFWYSFARSDEPDLGIAWPRLKEPSDKLHYMHIAGPKNFTMEANDNLAEEIFWNQIEA